MNILYVSAYSANTTGGVRSVVPQYLKHMSQIASVYIFSCRKIKYDCSQDKYYQIKSQSELKAKLREIDIVVFHEVYYIEYYGFAKHLVRQKIPYIVIPHCSLTAGAQEQKNYIKKIINKLWVNRFVRQALRIQYLSDYEKEASKVFEATPLVIPNGIEAACTKRRRYDKHDSVEFVFIGRFSVKQKGLDILVEACHLIKDSIIQKNIHINLYGTDFEGGKNYIQKKIHEYKLEECVKLYAPVYGDDKQRILLKSDVYILISRFEGMPVGILEAMRAGLPVLVTPGSGVYDIVEEQNCGWCTESNPDAVARTVLKISEEKDLWEAVSDNAIKTVENYYAWDKVAAVTEKEYEKLLLGNLSGVSKIG